MKTDGLKLGEKTKGTHPLCPPLLEKKRGIQCPDKMNHSGTGGELVGSNK